MDSKELRNLQEAYLEVVENQQLYEELTGDRLKRAREKIKSLGRRSSTLPSREALNRVSVGVEGTGTLGGRKGPTKRGGSGEKGAVKTTGSGAYPDDRGTGNKAARRAGKPVLNTGRVDEIYDIILSHLLDEGYADTNDNALVIMANMSEEWRDSIIEKSGEQPLPYGRMMNKSNELADSDDPEKQKRSATIYLAANAPKGPKVKVRK